MDSLRSAPLTGLSTFDRFAPPSLGRDAPPEVTLPAQGEATLLLDWDLERHGSPPPRRCLLPEGDRGPSWAFVPHARYVLCARHLKGRVETVYVMSLVGRRDSLIPAGSVSSIVTDERSVAVVVEGRPYLYLVEHGTTVDVTTRRPLGGGTGA